MTNDRLIVHSSANWRKASTKKIIEPVTGLRTAIEGILFDAEDFELIRPHKWRLTRDGYLLTSSPANRQTGIYIHRLIMNPSPDMQIDHINGNKLDNRRCNLRVCTRQQNHCNVPPHKDKKSRFKGVTKDADGRWLAKLKANGVHTYIGRFKDEADAALAYNLVACEKYGEFSYYNRAEAI